MLCVQDSHVLSFNIYNDQRNMGELWNVQIMNMPDHINVKKVNESSGGRESIS